MRSLRLRTARVFLRWLGPTYGSFAQCACRRLKRGCWFDPLSRLAQIPQINLPIAAYLHVPAIGSIRTRRPLGSEKRLNNDNMRCGQVWGPSNCHSDGSRCSYRRRQVERLGRRIHYAPANPPPGYVPILMAWGGSLSEFPLRQGNTLSGEYPGFFIGFADSL